jgi:mannose-1-phosphate guanylyltransferase
VLARASHDNVVHAEGGAVVLYGVSDLVVVTRDGLTLVTTVERSADLKALVEALPSWLAERLS